MIDRPVVSPLPSSEMRREPRAPVAWRGHLLIDARPPLAVRVADISAGGASVLLDDKLERQQAIVLQVSVPRLPNQDVHEMLQWRALVMHLLLQGRHWRAGLQFVDPSASDIALRTRWVERVSMR